MRGLTCLICVLGFFGLSNLHTCACFHGTQSCDFHQQCQLWHFGHLLNNSRPNSRWILGRHEKDGAVCKWDFNLQLYSSRYALLIEAHFLIHVVRVSGTPECFLAGLSDVGAGNPIGHCLSHGCQGVSYHPMVRQRRRAPQPSRLCYRTRS